MRYIPGLTGHFLISLAMLPVFVKGIVFGFVNANPYMMVFALCALAIALFYLVVFPRKRQHVAR